MFSGRLTAFYRQIVSSYAFVPSLFLLGGSLLAVMFGQLDSRFGGGWVGDLPILPGATEPDGARAILTTVGGSMLSVAGVVFSITLAAIVFASGQYGPHVMPQYRRDRFAQATLGMMLSVFAYSMIVLYSVHGGDTQMVPRLSIFGALVLTGIASIMLVSFIAHMLSMLHVSNIVAKIGGYAVAHLDTEMPTNGKTDREGSRLQDPVVGHDCAWLTEEGDPVIRANGTGYVQTEATGQLVDLAKKHDLLIDILVRPGDYVTPLTPVLRTAPTLSAPGVEREELTSDLLSALAYGRRRTPDEDAAFLLDELCAIGLRALSPGVNDPFTAIDVIHQLTAVTERAARGTPLDPIWRDDDDTPRVRRPILTFDDIVRIGLDRMAADVATNVTAAPFLIAAYDSLISQLEESDRLERLRRSAERFAALCEERLPTTEARKEAARDIAQTLDRSAASRGPGELRIARLEREVAR